MTIRLRVPTGYNLSAPLSASGALIQRDPLILNNDRSVQRESAPVTLVIGGMHGPWRASIRFRKAALTIT